MHFWDRGLWGFAWGISWNAVAIHGNIPWFGFGLMYEAPEFNHGPESVVTGGYIGYGRGSGIQGTMRHATYRVWEHVRCCEELAVLL